MQRKGRKKQLTSGEKEPTPRQARFAHYYTDPNGEAFGNATASAESAGYAGAPGSTQLAVQGHRTLHHPRVQQAIAASLVEQGFSPDFAARLLLNAMNAKTTKFVSAGKQGNLIEVIDHRTQVKALEVALRLFPAVTSAADASRRDTSTGENAPSTREETTQAAQELLLELLSSAEIVRFIQRLEERLQEVQAGSGVEPGTLDSQNISTSSNTHSTKEEHDA